MEADKAFKAIPKSEGNIYLKNIKMNAYNSRIQYANVQYKPYIKK